MASIKEVLRASNLFGGLTEEELDKLVALCYEEVYEPGAIVFTEGSVAKYLYIVKEGRVALEMKVHLGAQSRRDATTHVVGRGEPCGWSALAESLIMTMSARCLEPTSLIAIDGTSLRRLLEEDSRMGYVVMKRLVSTIRSRLRNTRETLAHILSIASHDLKAPLAAVESYLQVMMGGYAGEITDKQRNMLMRCSERIWGLLGLIDDILDISRIDSGQLKREMVSLLQVAEFSVENIRPLTEEKGIALKVKLPKELPQVYAAPDRLQQVITNLLSNAIKFTPPQGTVTLRVRERDEQIQVEVMDTGIGIGPDDLPRIFDEFYRGSNVQTQGAGLGLSIAKKIVEAHGGKIWVESPYHESKKGAKFTFTLPKTRAGAEKAVVGTAKN